MNEFIAKSKPEESIRAHTDQLLALLNELTRLYPESLSEDEQRLVRLAAEYHDYGKACYLFQRSISQKLGRSFQKDEGLEALYSRYPHFPHGYLSPAFLPIPELRNTLGDQGTVALVNAIYYHHTRPLMSDGDIEAVLQQDLKPRLGAQYPLSHLYLTLVLPLSGQRDHPLSTEILLRGH